MPVGDLMRERAFVIRRELEKVLDFESGSFCTYKTRS
jgi:hypothetical protein